MTSSSTSTSAASTGSVPSDVPWRKLTKEQRTTICMWFALGLPVEWGSIGRDWCIDTSTAVDTPTISTLDRWPDVQYRLRPK